MGTGSFPGVKCGRGVLLTTHSLLEPRSWKSRAIPLPTLWATPGFYLFIILFLFFFFFFLLLLLLLDWPWGPSIHLYNGYRIFPRAKCGRGVLLTTHSPLVPRSWKSRAIPLPTLWATPGLYLFIIIIFRLALGPPILLYNGYRVFPRVKCGRGVLLNTHSLLEPRSWKSRAIPLPTLWATPGLYLIIIIIIRLALEPTQPPTQ